MTRILLSLSILLLILVGCSNQPKDEANNFTIYTTVYGLEAIVKQITPETVTVKSIYPEGADAHHFELTSQQIKDINNADMFIYIDNDFEPFAKDLVATLNKSVTVIEVNQLAAFTDLVSATDKNSDGSLKDYHTFLYPVYAGYMGNALSPIIQAANPTSNSTSDYEQLLITFNEEMTSLNTQFEELSGLNIYVSHDAYYY